MGDDKLDKTGKISSSTNDADSSAGSNAQASARERLAGTDLTPYADENANLGTALRRVYQQTVDESVPSEMLDLLKRLN